MSPDEQIAAAASEVLVHCKKSLEAIKEREAKDDREKDERYNL